MAEAKVDPGVLYAAVDRKRQSQGLSWRDLARKLQLSPSTFTRMAQGRRPDVDTFATLLRWLNMPAEMFVTPRATDGEEPEPMAMISTYLRSSRNIHPDDADALEDIIQAAYRRIVREKPDG